MRHCIPYLGFRRPRAWSLAAAKSSTATAWPKLCPCDEREKDTFLLNLLSSRCLLASNCPCKQRAMSFSKCKRAPTGINFLLRNLYYRIIIVTLFVSFLYHKQAKKSFVPSCHARKCRKCSSRRVTRMEWEPRVATAKGSLCTLLVWLRNIQYEISRAIVFAATH